MEIYLKRNKKSERLETFLFKQTTRIHLETIESDREVGKLLLAANRLKCSRGKLFLHVNSIFKLEKSKYNLSGKSW
jgi:hypothetical protein